MLKYVRPAHSGGRIRMPERNSRPMPKEGAFVSGDFYERLIASGDLVECDPPSEAPAVTAADQAPITVTEAPKEV